MEYFVLSQDETFKNGVVIDQDRLPEELKTSRSLGRKINLYLQNAPFNEKSFNLMVKSNVNNYYSDLIEIPLFLISDQLKKILCSYESGLQCNCAILSDRIHKIQKVYWLCTLEKVDCLGKNTEFYSDHSLKKLVLDETKIGNKKIFQVSGIREQRIIVNLDVMESILRRPFTGIHMEKACVECAYYTDD